MTDLAPRPPLRNRYYGFRHGQSEANVQGIILSDPAIGTKRYGLTDVGRQQVAESARAHRDVLERAVLYSSDFLRTKQTAEEIVSVAGLSTPVRYDIRLRERFFGDFDGGSNEAYHLAWQGDRQSAKRTEHGVESVTHVAERMSAFIRELEGQSADRDVVLVGHGDPFQIAEAWLRGDDLRNHTSHSFETGEMRLLNPAALH
ncbi:MAG TPA: histidine phosphatase family protein [Patescibacteria group bacterium]|jgi:probable phosphoglycerate mutase